MLVYEAMKMENNLASDRDGVIAKLLIEEGGVMATDQPIIEFAAAGAAPAKAAAPAPRPVAKPAAAAHKVEKVADVKVSPVAGFDENKALHPIEGGSGSAPASLQNYKGEPALRLAPGTTLDINVLPRKHQHPHHLWQIITEIIIKCEEAFQKSPRFYSTNK